MAKIEVEVTIDAEGNVEFHGVGMRGKGCLAALGELERALGKRTDYKPTPDMYLTEVATAKVKK